jgi:hypothetical protein
MSLNDETPPGKHGAYPNPFSKKKGRAKGLVQKKGKHSKKKKKKEDPPSN